MEEQTQTTIAAGRELPVAEDIRPEEAPAPTGSPALDEMVARLTELYPGSVLEAFAGLDMPTLRVSPASLVDVCRWLRDDSDARYNMLSDITCADYLGREPRFDVVVHLCSQKDRVFLRVKAGIPENPAVCPSLTEVWPGANWAEREVWDMYGIHFAGHPDMNRILTPEGWEYFALRRDFPLHGPGMVKLYDSVTDVF